MKEVIEELNELLKQDPNSLKNFIDLDIENYQKDKRKEEIKKKYISIIDSTKNYVKTAKEIPEILEHIFNHINQISKAIETKKVYKHPYNTSYEDFSKISTYEKIRNLMIKKQKNNLLDTHYNGGNCHNWSLLYSDFFEELDPKFLNFEPYSNHSILVIDFDNKIYIADSNQEEKFNIKKIKLGEYLDIGNHYVAKVVNLKPLRFDISYNKSLDRIEEPNFEGKFFNNKYDFIKYLDNKENTYFLLEYNNIESNGEKTFYSFYIDKIKNKLIINIEGILGKKNRKISFPIHKIKNKENKDIIDEVFKKTKIIIPNDKQEIIDGIISKIPDGFLYKLLYKKTKK